MLVAGKYTLVSVAVLTATICILAGLRLHDELNLFDHDMQRDHRLIGAILNARIEDVVRRNRGSEQMAERIDRVLKHANSAQPRLRFSWTPVPPPGAATQELQGDVLLSRFPVLVDGEVTGALDVRESLDERTQLLSSHVRGTLWTVALLAVVSALLAFVLGRWIVGVPIALLVAKARLIAAGNFSHPLRLHSQDELGDLAREINAMCRDLERSAERVAQETEAKLAAIDQMRHGERLATVGKLAAGLAHELGTPLSIVQGRAQMIAHGEVHDAQARQSADVIDREASRMSLIVRQLLDFARRQGPLGGVCDAREIITRSADLLRPSAERNFVEIALQLPAAPVPITIDSGSLQQVITNLLSNGLQASNAGGALRVSLSEARLVPRAWPDGLASDYARIDVVDRGSGIARTTLPHIFEPFFTTKAPGEGTGLGLAVVEGIVEDHRGWVSVDSGDSGTTFSVFLPKAEA
jgi:two-component system NtrC family sensor kinase